MKKVLKYLFIILISYLCIVFVYFEFGRPFEIGLLEYNDDLYEKDFLAHSYVLTMYDTEYEFSKAEIFPIEEQKISGTVKVLFSQEPYWALSDPYHLSITFKGEKSVEEIIGYLIKNGAKLEKEKGSIIKEDRTEDETDFYYWLIGNQKIYTNYHGIETDTIEELALWKNIKPSPFFLYHI
jgi:hypothetical protein